MEQRCFFREGDVKSMGRNPIKTTHREIVEYWFSRVDESELSVDAAEAHERCWRCGCKKALERCHIVPDSLEGRSKPENLVLLCKRCHADGPNVSDPEIMWDWIKPFYDMFWKIIGAREYEFIYHKTLAQEIWDMELFSPDREEELEAAMREVVREVAEMTSYHFGQPYMNTATVAGNYRMALKRLAKRYGKSFPSGPVRAEKPWWM